MGQRSIEYLLKLKEDFNETFDDFIDGAGEAEDKIDDLTESGDSFFSGFAGGFSSLLTGPIGIAALGVGIAALGKQVFDFQQELEDNTRDVALLTGEVDDNLTALTANIRATADVFDSEFNAVLEASNALAKQMGISQQEAIDIINKGFAAGADVTGELLTQLREYPAQFKAVGLSAEESIAIITQQVKTGVFSDKGIDVIKEAGIRLRELTPATREALEGIGLSSDEIERSLASGSKTLFEVTQDVGKALSKLPPNAAKVGTAIADIFGGPGEDAGLDFITSLSTMELSLDNILEQSGEFATTQLRLVRSTARLDTAIGGLFDNSFGIVDELKIGFNELFADGINSVVEFSGKVSDFFGDLMDDSIVFRGIIEGTVAAFKTILDAVVLNFTLMITAGKTAAKTIGAVLEGDIGGALDAITAGGEEFVQDFVDFGQSAADNFNTAFGNTIDPPDAPAPGVEGTGVAGGAAGGVPPLVPGGAVGGQDFAASEIRSAAPRTINLNIGSLIDTLTQNINNTGESGPELQEQVTQAMLTALRDAQISFR